MSINTQTILNLSKIEIAARNLVHATLTRSSDKVLQRVCLIYLQHALSDMDAVYGTTFDSESSLNEFIEKDLKAILKEINE